MPVGAEEPTVIRAPGSVSGSASEARAHAFTLTDEAQTASVVSPTLKRLFDAETEVFGIRLGDFVLESPLGTGGMGAVFKAHDARLGRKVAFKVLSPQATLDAKLVSRFHNEARATARLSHDNIARVYSSGEDLGVHYIAYELIDGTNLRQLIQARGIVSPSEAVSYAIQIAMALNHTVAAGVVHRDIKPSNIIITPEGRARVVDLGLARRESDDSIADLTVAGATLGTFDYISPEQAQNPSNVDVRSDIYSLGCTIFHMLTGQAPYPEGTALQKLLDHKGKDAPAPIEVNRKVPKDLSAVVHRMMASEPEDRHATPAILVEDLMHIAARMGLRGIQPEGLVWKRPGETRPPFMQNNLGWISIAAILVFGALLLRLQPHELSTDWQAGRLSVVQGPIVEPEPASTPTSQNAPRDDGTAVGLNGVNVPPENSDVLPTQPLATGSGVLGLLSKAAETVQSAFKNAISNPPNSVVTTGSPDVGTETTMTAPAALARFSLQSDPTTSFDTLQAACWAAEDGEVIVVRPNPGNAPHIEKPLRIVRKNITIRGEPRNDRVPLIRFDVGEEPSDNQSRMMTIVGGDVRLANLDIQIVTRDDVGADRWIFCALKGAERVRLNNVNIDFPNTVDLEASVFEITMGDDAAMARMQNAAGEYLIRITGGYVRGNCRLVHAQTALPGSIEVTNAMVSLAKPLLYVAGINDVLMDRDHIDLELTHTTCVLPAGLICMSNIDAVDGPAQELVPIEVVSENNVFATTTDEPLVRMEGTSAPEEFEALLLWTGQKNLYDGFRIYWERDSSLTGLGVYEDTFDDWTSVWASDPETSEVGAMTDADPWLSDRWRSQSIVRAQPTDFEIDPASRATSAATDGTNLGVDLPAIRRLPTFTRN
jgi:serine/threonine-protein kinase